MDTISNEIWLVHHSGEIVTAHLNEVEALRDAIKRGAQCTAIEPGTQLVYSNDGWYGTFYN